MAGVRERIRARRERLEAQGNDPWANRIAAIALIIGVGSMAASYGQYVATQRSIDVSRQIANEQLKFAEQVVRDNNRDTQEALALTRSLATSGTSLAGSGAEQTRQSTRVADSSLVSTQTAISALNESVGNFRNQLRAYVDIEVYAEQDRAWSNADTFPVRFTNFGASPAYAVGIIYRMWTHKPGEPVPELNSVEKEHPWSSTGSFRLAKSKVIAFEKAVPKAQMEEVMAGKSELIFQLQSEYSDIYGSKHATDYCVTIKGNSHAECAVQLDD